MKYTHGVKGNKGMQCDRVEVRREENGRRREVNWSVNVNTRDKEKKYGSGRERKKKTIK